MAKSLPDALEQLQKIVGGISGIRSAPDSPPERASAFPFVICFPSTGTYRTDSAYTSTDTAIHGEHTLICQLHVARRDLPRAFDKALPYAELIKNVLFKQANIRFSGTIDTIIEEITYTFGGLEYAGVETLGYSFSIPIKIRNDTTTT